MEVDSEPFVVGRWPHDLSLNCCASAEQRCDGQEFVLDAAALGSMALCNLEGKGKAKGERDTGSDLDSCMWSRDPRHGIKGAL